MAKRTEISNDWIDKGAARRCRPAVLINGSDHDQSHTIAIVVITVGELGSVELFTLQVYLRSSGVIGFSFVASYFVSINKFLPVI